MYTDEQNDYGFARELLTPGEAILWKGRPGRGHLVSREDALLIPFSILWCGFAFFWEFTAITMGAPFFFWLWGIPFLLVGLYLVVGRFLHTAWSRRRTFYVITTKKILRRRGSRTDMLDIHTLPPMYMTSFADGTGTIRFGQRTYSRRGVSMGGQSFFSLEVIDQVARVHGIISQAQSQ